MSPLLATTALADFKPIPGKASLASEDFDVLLRTVAKGADAPTGGGAPEEDGAAGGEPAVAIPPGASQPDLAQLRSLIAAMTGVTAPASVAADQPPPSAVGAPEGKHAKVMHSLAAAAPSEVTDVGPVPNTPAPTAAMHAAGEKIAAASDETLTSGQLPPVDTQPSSAGLRQAVSHALPNADGAAETIALTRARVGAPVDRPASRSRSDAVAKASKPAASRIMVAAGSAPSAGAAPAQPNPATPAVLALKSTAVPVPAAVVTSLSGASAAHSPANLAGPLAPPSAEGPASLGAAPITGKTVASAPTQVSPGQATAAVVTVSGAAAPPSVVLAMLAMAVPTGAPATAAADVPPPAALWEKPVILATSRGGADDLDPSKSPLRIPIRPDKDRADTAAEVRLGQHPADIAQVVAAVGGKDAVPRSDGAVPPSASAAPIAEIMVTHHLNLAKDSAWLDQLTHDIVRSADTNGAIRFSLAPEHLGRLDVTMAQTAVGTVLRLNTETREAHRIISDAQPRLVAEARAQGLTLSEMSVDLGRRSDGAQSQAFGNQNSGGGRQSQHAGWQPGPNAQASVTEHMPAAGRDDDLYA